MCAITSAVQPFPNILNRWVLEIVISLPSSSTPFKVELSPTVCSLSHSKGDNFLQYTPSTTTLSLITVVKVFDLLSSLTSNLCLVRPAVSFYGLDVSHQLNIGQSIFQFLVYQEQL